MLSRRREVGRLIGRSKVFNDARGGTDSQAIRRHRLCHDGVGTDHCAFTDRRNDRALRHDDRAIADGDRLEVISLIQQMPGVIAEPVVAVGDERAVAEHTSCPDRQ